MDSEPSSPTLSVISLSEKSSTIPTPSITSPPENSSSTSPEITIKVSDPSTPEGQKPGAILILKRTAHLPPDNDSYFCDGCECECGCSETEHNSCGTPELPDDVAIGDFVEVKSFGRYNPNLVIVHNLRTETEAYVHWDSFSPLLVGQKCACVKKDRCRCVVEDPILFWSHRLALIGKGTFPPW